MSEHITCRYKAYFANLDLTYIISRQFLRVCILFNCEITARCLIWGRTSFYWWYAMITWSSWYYVHGTVIHDVRSFPVRMYYGSPNSQFDSFVSVLGLCDPRPYEQFIIPFFLNLPLSGLWFGSAVTVVFGGVYRIIITYLCCICK